jgi:magnesium chelatase family protein
MLAKVMSCAVVGLEGTIVEVEADISPGLPTFTIVVSPYRNCLLESNLQ